MHFARPEYLNLLWAVPALAAFLTWRMRERRRRLERLVSPVLAGALTAGVSRRKAIARVALVVGFCAASVLALARPQWGARVELVRRRGLDIIVALDTSHSMNAEDVQPSRLEMAKGEIRSLVRKLRGDRIGLVTFAGTALVACPLTLDYGAVELFLDAIDTSAIPEPGTSLAAAIETATSAFSSKERKYKVLVILTDGEDLEGAIDAAVRSAREAGVLIYTIGIGTPEGRPVPVRDEKGSVVEYLKDPNGQVVISRLDERSLARVAGDTGGRYYRASTAGGELDELYGEVSRLDKKELESRLYQNYEDRFQYPLALAIACLAIEAWLSERRAPRRSQRNA